MEIERKAAALRAARAWLGLDQLVAAQGAGLGERSVQEAERARACSVKTWEALTRFYGSRGVHWDGRIRAMETAGADAPASAAISGAR